MLMIIGGIDMKDMKKGNLTPENKKIASNRNLKVKICLKCHSHNSINAKRCRKCGYGNLRLKTHKLDKKGDR